MYNLHYKILSVLFGLGLLGCNKNLSDFTSHSAALVVFNASTNIPSEIQVNLTGQKINYAEAEKLGYSAWDGKFANGSRGFALEVGKQNSIVITSAGDSTKPMFGESVTPNSGDAYSVFITGSGSEASGLLVKDEISHHSDSVVGIRFINLSPNAGPISVNLEGAANGSEFPSVGFKEITSFKTYPISTSDQFYIFEIRNATSGELLFTHFANQLPTFRNVTIIIRGLVGGAPGFNATRFEHR